MPKGFPVKAKVQIFPVENPWVYVSIPEHYTEMFQEYANRGLIPVSVQLGGSNWDTSLMPKGDGTHFIPLSKKIRKRENINVGDIISLEFFLR